jgi:hypothetical protein
VKKPAKPASAESQEQRNLRHGEDFRDLEAPMRDLGGNGRRRYDDLEASRTWKWQA